ncbi:amidase [Pontibacterium granulatum]|uniref:amidase n=1 Tax=Pontibacterium granulatum TaxID=2036029 RepID=UPI00249AE747|nr:amidase [Pontibacterium granulatum]MDI3325196.1 amidase [Pontibacterium granulatum]
MLSTDPSQWSLSAMLAAIKQGEQDTETLINACFDAVDQREAELNAWQFLRSRQQVLQTYRDNRTFYDRSPLKGLPVGIKDIIDTAEMPTELGSPIHRGRRPHDDATCVVRLKQAGAIIMGKTVTTEFAYFKPGDTVNPHDPRRTPGGSSSGSAAAVAAGMVPLALGSQTAASVIRPAAFCGISGYVCTRGELSLRGVQPLAQSLDALGILSRSAQDASLVRTLLLGQSAAAIAPVKPKSVLLCLGSAIGETDPAMTEALIALSRELRVQGIEIQQLHSCDLLKRLVALHHQILAFEARRNLAYEAAHPEQLSEPFRELMVHGDQISYAEYLDALASIRKIGVWLWKQHAEADLILAPSAPGVAPLGTERTGLPHMSRPWQALGLPVINLPGARDSEGLPLGLQLVGRPHDDERLLAVAAWIEHFHHN